MSRLSILLLFVLPLAGNVIGCAAVREARVGAPKEQWLGPLAGACDEAAKYSGSSDAAVGIAKAEETISSNALVIVRYGTRIVMLPRPLYNVRHDAFLEEHGIRYEEGDHMFPPRGEFFTYNCRIDQEIRRRHGADFWVRADTQARAI